jgi:hypothetical protein
MFRVLEVGNQNAVVGTAGAKRFAGLVLLAGLLEGRRDDDVTVPGANEDLCNKTSKTLKEKRERSVRQVVLLVERMLLSIFSTLGIISLTFFAMPVS